jgi:triacylglycerol lipase
MTTKNCAIGIAGSGLKAEILTLLLPNLLGTIGFLGKSGVQSIATGAHATYVGRVGGLAVALGIGAAVLTGVGCGVAWADTAGSTSSSSDSPSTRAAAKSDSGSSAEDATPAEIGDVSERTETSVGSPVSRGSSQLRSSLRVPRSAPPGVVVSTGGRRTSSRASGNGDGSEPDKREATSSSQAGAQTAGTAAATKETPDTDAPGARAASRHATAPPAESDRSLRSDSTTLASTSPSSPIQPADGGTTETMLFTAAAATEQEAVPSAITSAPPAEIVFTMISSVLSPLTNDMPTTPVALPTLWTLVGAVGREYERTTFIESSTLAGQVTNGLVQTSTISEPATFTGQPSIVSQVVTAAYRVLRVVTDILGVDAFTPFFQLTGSDRPPWFTTLGLNVQRSEFDGWAVYELQPANPSGKYVVAVHGGAYVFQTNILFHWLDYAAVARDTGATVVVPIYPLAPQGTAGTVVPVMADLVSSQIDQHGAENVSVYGDSAGAGLGLAAVQELVRRGDPVPSHMVLVSPWLDVTMSNPASQSIDDPLWKASVLRRDGELWAGGLDLTDPLVSPLYGSLAGLPPTAVYAGSSELLAPDVLVLQDNALATPSADFTFILRKGELHDWPTVWWLLPEAQAVRPDIYQQLGLG